MEQREKMLFPQRKNGFLATGCVVLYGICFIVLNIVWTGIISVALPPSVMKTFPALFYLAIEVGVLISALVPAYVLLVYVERRPFAELGLAWRGQGEWIYSGFLIALLLFMVGFGISLVSGEVVVTGIHFNPSDLLLGFLFFVLVAFAEEIMVRGYVLGCLLRAGMNRFLALGLSSLLFALLHVFNPAIAFLPMLNLVLAGVLLGSVYIYTRNLWFSISLHLFWNWIQGPVLGYQVSGNNFLSSLLTLRITEPNLINGGTFGFEGSIVCTVVVVVAIVGIILWFEQRLG